MNSEELRVLQESVAARGVVESIRVTPIHRAPWAHINPSDTDKFFLIVSGHRRTQAALGAELPSVPIKVVIYANERDHRLDASILNDNRPELSSLERGHEFLTLKKLGWTIEDLEKRTGRSRPYLEQRINLTRLDPSLQELMNDDVTRTRKKRKLTVPVGSALGLLREPTQEELAEMKELVFTGAQKDLGDEFIPSQAVTADERRFMLQRMLYTVVSARGLPATSAVTYIQDRKVKLTGTRNLDLGANPRRHEPARRQPLMENLLNSITMSAVADWSEDDYKRTYEYVIREDMDMLVKVSERAEKIVSFIRKKITEIRDRKPETSPEVLKFMKSKKK
jgi:ParB/RepB/Spo0J family partition protein